jgi:hypothetical protein
MTLVSSALDVAGDRPIVHLPDPGGRRRGRR